MYVCEGVTIPTLPLMFLALRPLQETLQVCVLLCVCMCVCVHMLFCVPNLQVLLVIHCSLTLVDACNALCLYVQLFCEWKVLLSLHSLVDKDE